MRVERILLLVCALPLVGCGSPTASKPGARTPLDDYVKCMSSVPVDPGVQNEPKISIRGSSEVDQPLGSPYTDQGATAIDPRDGDINGKISVTGLSALNINLVGDYMIRYNVINSAQTPAVEAVRMVRVNSGTFSAQTARDIGATGTHMGYYEHLPVHYSDDPNQRFPLIVFIHGWGRARFLDPYTEQTPLSNLGDVNLSGLINGVYGTWDASQPFIVLSPQKCVDALTYGGTAHRMKLFVDYAVNTYKVDTSRIYMGGHSQGSGDTWDYVTNYPRQLAAIFPISGGYGTDSGCALKNTPAWAFAGELDSPVNSDQVNTVASIDACNPPERAKITILPGANHNTAETEVLTLSGLGRGIAPHDIYDQSIYNWLLAHKLPK